MARAGKRYSCTIRGADGRMLHDGVRVVTDGDGVHAAFLAAVEVGIEFDWSRHVDQFTVEHMRGDFHAGNSALVARVTAVRYR